jgi:GTP-binding protein
LENREIKVVEAKFIKSAKSIKDSVSESLSEIAFLGRSNVGKSSTINLLSGRKNLAKSSSTPGKTKLINFFDILYRVDEVDYPIRFVDLPGFGYAKVSHSVKKEWQDNLVEFIKNRVAIRVFIHLRDARHPNSKIDNDVEKLIKGFIRGDQNYLTVFTKADKLKQKEKSSLLKSFPQAILISNLKKSGGEKVKKEILKKVFGDI